MFWYDAILQIIKDNYDVGETIYRSNIIDTHLSKIVKLTGSKAEKPQNQVTPNLVKLCDMGYLEQTGPGKYKIINLSLEKSKKGSMGERILRSVLDELGIKYEEQKKFSDLKDKAHLSYDFCFSLKNKLFLLEFDGAQHHAPVAHWGGPSQFVKQKMHDAQKTNYAAQNGHILIRFSSAEREIIKLRLTASIYKRNLWWYLARNYTINLIIRANIKAGFEAAVLFGPKKIKHQKALFVYYKILLLLYKIGQSTLTSKQMVTLNLKLLLILYKVQARGN